jgi:pyruvate ferredoxin oxidoreductase beta subunit
MPKNKRPVEDYLRLQGRFKHLFTKENEHLIHEIQVATDETWQRLLNKCEA